MSYLEIRRLVAAPAQEPLDLQTEAKKHLRVDHDEEDERISRLITAVRMWAEDQTERALITQTWELGLSCFPVGSSSEAGGLAPRLMLPFPPLQEVVSVQYVDFAGDTQTWDPSTYDVHAPVGPRAQRGWIQPRYGEFYPSTLNVTQAVTVQFKAGYGDAAAAVPQPIREAMLLRLGELYARRETGIVGTIFNETGADMGLLFPYCLKRAA